MKNLKYIILSFVLGGTAVGGVLSLNLGATELTSKELSDIQAEVLITHKDKVDWVKPTTDEAWAEDVKKENLDVKYTKQLEEMSVSHKEKLAREEAELPKYVECPDCIRWEMREQLAGSGLTGKELEAEVEKQTQEAINNRLWSVEKLKQSVERIDKEIELRNKGFVEVISKIDPNDPQRKVVDEKGSKVRSPLGTAYYIDFSNCGGNGLATTTPFCSIDEFADVARSAGDIAFVRRGVATTTDISDVLFTSSGTLTSPIILSADYDNLWSDFATSSVTWTPTFGSKFIASSASSTDFTEPNMWIYFESDCYEVPSGTLATKINPCEFAYEIASSSPAGIDLYLPYKGNQTGAGQEIRTMPPAPIWNTITGDFQINLSSDDYWRLNGLEFRGTDSTGIFQINTTAQGIYLSDSILTGDSNTVMFITNFVHSLVVDKTRFLNASNNPNFTSAGGTLEDSLIDCGNANSVFGVSTGSVGNLIKNVELTTRCTGNDVLFNGQGLQKITFVNTKRIGTYNGLYNTTYDRIVFAEDDFGLIGLNQILRGNSPATTTMSTTTNLRIGGGLTNQVVFPPVGTGNNAIASSHFPFSFYKLFEYPIYADTSSKTYTMYFNSTSTTNFVTDPTVEEMWIECEYYADASDADRRLKKSSDGLATSTFAVDFNGSTDWQAISVTCQPTQAGVLYLRGWYGQNKNSTDGSHWFYMDTTPVIQ